MEPRASAIEKADKKGKKEEEGKRKGKTRERGKVARESRGERGGRGQVFMVAWEMGNTSKHRLLRASYTPSLPSHLLIKSGWPHNNPMKWT